MQSGEISWQGDVFSMGLIGVMTFVLITSSATMASAVQAAFRDDLKTAYRYVLPTALGGLVFRDAGVRLDDAHHGGSKPYGHPWGVPAFSAFFFLITGFHGTHVLIGVLVLLITANRVKKGRTGGNGVELTGLYWHFVDLVWVFIFTCFYLI